jgi:hypothetical protein
MNFVFRQLHSSREYVQKYNYSHPTPPPNHEHRSRSGPAERSERTLEWLPRQGASEPLPRVKPDFTLLRPSPSDHRRRVVPTWLLHARAQRTKRVDPTKLVPVKMHSTNSCCCYIHGAHRSIQATLCCIVYLSGNIPNDGSDCSAPPPHSILFTQPRLFPEELLYLLCHWVFSVHQP